MVHISLKWHSTHKVEHQKSPIISQTTANQMTITWKTLTKFCIILNKKLKQSPLISPFLINKIQATQSYLLCYPTFLFPHTSFQSNIKHLCNARFLLQRSEMAFCLQGCDAAYSGRSSSSDYVPSYRRRLFVKALILQNWSFTLTDRHN